MNRDSFSAIKTTFTDITDTATFKREIGFALQIFNGNSYINGASIESKLTAVLNVASIGLTLNPALKLAYLVPRYNSSKRLLEVVLEASYQGMVKLITDTGSARNVYAYPVYEGDDFSVGLGTSPTITHIPQYKSTEVVKVYAVAILSDGTTQIEVMTIGQIEDIRATSESYKSFLAKKSKSCIWDTHFDEMSRKTVIKRICKYLPKTDIWDKLSTAIDLSNMDHGASYEQRDYVESLLMNANIPAEQSQALYKELPIMNADRAGEVISMLKANQIDPVEAGHSYNQTEVLDKMKGMS